MKTGYSELERGWRDAVDRTLARIINEIQTLAADRRLRRRSLAYPLANESLMHCYRRPGLERPNVRMEAHMHIEREARKSIDSTEYPQLPSAYVDGADSTE